MEGVNMDKLYAEDFKEYAKKQSDYEVDHYDPFVDNEGNLNLCLSDILNHIVTTLEKPETVNEPTLRLLLAEIRCILDERVEDTDWAFKGSELEAVVADLRLVEGIFDRRLR